MTLTPGVPYGATAGNAGTSITNASLTQISGTQSGANCVPDMTVFKSHVAATSFAAQPPTIVSWFQT